MGETTLISREEAALLVVDFQDSLLEKIKGAGTILDQSVRLIRIARELGLPSVLTEQYPKGLGKTTARIKDELPDVAALEKVSFGCFGAAGFEERLKGLGRGQLVVIGIEAHVCVLQTVLPALERGYQVFVVRDAIGSRAREDCKAGLSRMQFQGAQVVTAEMAIFELLGAAGTPEFKRVLPLLKG